MKSEDSDDLRVRRTRSALKRSLVDLMADRRFDSVTVRAIAEAAMVSRATFYRHYRDKEDLAAAIFLEATSGLVESMAAAGARGDQPPPRCWVEVFEHFAGRRALYRDLLRDRRSPWFTLLVRDRLTRASMAYQDGMPFQRSRLRLPPQIASVALGEALVGATVWWLDDGVRHEPIQVAGWLLQLAGGPPLLHADSTG